MHRIVAVLAISAMAMAIAACGGDKPASNGAPAKAPVIMRKAVPADYKDMAPPEGMDLTSAEAIAAGKTLYEGVEAACATCHGMGGKGDGAAGAALNPKPTDLTSDEFQNGAKDDYIFWRIRVPAATSGPANSGMAGFNGGTDEQIWQLVAYVRSLKGK